MATIEQLAPSWLPPELARAWFTEYSAMGGADVVGSGEAAAEMIRQDSKYREVYDRYFPGSRRDDGSLRLPEADYFNQIQSYRDSLQAVGLNPDIYEDKFGGMIETDVDGGEFTRRVEGMYERVIEAAPALRQFYAENFALDFTDQAIVASFMDPDVGDAILNKRLAISEIGGEATQRGFDLDVEQARQLEQAGVSRTQAQDLFGQAGMDVPALNVLARRHADPDDTFDINEFTQAMVFDDPDQRRRMRRLMAQERSSFTGASSMREDRSTGGVTGLAER